MKKLLLSLLVLIPVTSLNADIKFDTVNNSFYSYPVTPDIDQNKYHDIWTKVIQIFEVWLAYYGVYVEDLLSLTNNERNQLENLLNNAAAQDNLNNRLNAYFNILDIQAKIDHNHYKTILRFFLDLELMNIMGQKLSQIICDAKK